MNNTILTNACNCVIVYLLNKAISSNSARDRRRHESSHFMRQYEICKTNARNCDGTRS